MGILKKFDDFEKGRTLPRPLDLSNPEHREIAMRHFHWADHAILRYSWTNLCEIAPGVYRSNHPGHARWERHAAEGLKSVINLRGANDTAPHFLFEKESTDALGLTRYDNALHARAAPEAEAVLNLLEIFKTIEKPFLMHCKSGADRAGFASTLYLYVVEGQPLSEARKMLSLRFLHLKWTKTGILDMFLDAFEARHAETGITLEDWLRNEYDAGELQKAFDKSGRLPI